jgi:hypothetical protein
VKSIFVTIATAFSAFALAPLALTVGCGEETPEPAPRAPDAEAAWLELLGSLDLEPARATVGLSVGGGAPELRVTIVLPADAPGETAFADGLYGATAYTFIGERWQRVDTAEIRTQIAPLLRPGETAELSLPVREAGSYRVLVPVEGRAAWADSA